MYCTIVLCYSKSTFPVWLVAPIINFVLFAGESLQWCVCVCVCVADKVATRFNFYWHTPVKRQRDPRYVSEEYHILIDVILFLYHTKNLQLTWLNVVNIAKFTHFYQIKYLSEHNKICHKLVIKKGEQMCRRMKTIFKKPKSLNGEDESICWW